MTRIEMCTDLSPALAVARGDVSKAKLTTRAGEDIKAGKAIKRLPTLKQGKRGGAITEVRV